MNEQTWQNDGRGHNLTNESLMDLLLAAEKRADAAEATIERVVKLCANTQRRFDASIRHPTAIAAISIDDVLRALDGDT